jgi:hypothetical protein
MECGAKGNAFDKCPNSKNGSCRPHCDGTADMTVEVGAGYLNGDPFYDFILSNPVISGKVKFRSCRPHCDGTADMTVEVGAGYLNGDPFYDFILSNPVISGKVKFRRTVSDEHPFELCSVSTATGFLSQCLVSWCTDECG